MNVFLAIRDVSSSRYQVLADFSSLSFLWNIDEYRKGTIHLACKWIARVHVGRVEAHKKEEITQLDLPF